MKKNIFLILLLLLVFCGCRNSSKPVDDDIIKDCKYGKFGDKVTLVRYQKVINWTMVTENILVLNLFDPKFDYKYKVYVDKREEQDQFEVIKNEIYEGFYIQLEMKLEDNEYGHKLIMLCDIITQQKYEEILQSNK